MATARNTGADAHDDADTVLRHVENVVIRVAALVGFHAVLHQTAMLSPSTLASWDSGPLPQHCVGGLAFNV